ncbi:Chitinase 1 [Daldinia childiae]|uniref:Chitinase 1 n=1 Tax=Daldinia childiae TaxID=326645 RepID=UPI001447D374|nr:Chitinase 1 [Daldinia childiae]KAF3057454.1 Chitinase 1 [Daldinia childiae]
MHISRAVTTATAAAAPRFAMYYDQWHTASPSKDQMAGITHVVTAFAGTTLFTSDPAGSYSPFVDVGTLRSQFPDGTKMCVAIGGWGDTSGFSVGQKDDTSRKTYAKGVAAMLESHGYDCVDVDWEYPGGNGEDYKQNPNSGKVDEIANYALLLQEIKSAIGDKELSIAVPGLERDMIAFTSEQVPKINDAVDVVNVMAYDLMNRRDTQTTHHTSVKASLATVDKYISLGMDASKLNLGFAFYAKYFVTQGECTQPIGCPTVQLEDANGGDTGKSGAVTFLEGPPVLSSGKADTEEGGQWYWDAAESKFWTWDTPDFIAQKFEQIVKARGLGGVMAWSLGEDSADWTYVKAIQAGLATL